MISLSNLLLCASVPLPPRLPAGQKERARAPADFSAETRALFALGISPVAYFTTDSTRRFFDQAASLWPVSAGTSSPKVCVLI